MEYLVLAIVGLAGGVVAGLTGVGGGILFVPALAILLDEPQLRAEATSLLAILPVALAGTWRQASHGNLSLRDALALGLLSPLGVGPGVLLANALPPRALELAFAGLLLAIAAQLNRRALRSRPSPARAPRSASTAAGSSVALPSARS
jgi:uncharacterized protein